MADEQIASGSFTHTLEQIDAAVDAVDGKQDELTFDTKPTSGSTNPVESGGIFNEIYVTSTAIASGTNLNLLTDAGKYRCENATIAASLSNCPYTESGFFLLVETSGTDMIQTIISDTCEIMYKRINTGTWYSFSNDTLISGITYGTGKEIIIDSVTAANNDLDLYRTSGTYYAANADTARALSHCPFTNYGFRLEVRAVGTARCTQFLYPMTRQSTHYGEGEFYMRQYGTDGTWTSWYKFSGTAVST